jgi:acetyltransferase-like isoleucine patch superfamily enzyme
VASEASFDERTPADATFDGADSPRWFTMGPGSRGRPRVHVYKGDTARVRVGAGVTIENGVEFVVGGNHLVDRVTTSPLQERYDLPGAFTEHPTSKGDIVVGDDVHVGRNAKVMSGVTIGVGAVIRASSVVTRDVPAGATVAGNPARVVDSDTDMGSTDPVESRPRRRRRSPAIEMGHGSYFPPSAHALTRRRARVVVGSYSSLGNGCDVEVREQVTIGSDVWCGLHVRVRGDVVVGHGSVVGAYSVVDRDVAPYTIVAGAPLKTIRPRFDADIVAALLRIKWWDWPPDDVLERWRVLCSTDVRAFVERYDC